MHPDSSTVVVGRDGLSEGSPVYEILFGGWANSKSAIRKHGIQKKVVTKTDKQDAVIRSTNVFSSYWITIYDDWLYAGVGELGSNEILRWQDPKASAKIKCIGFSSWNTPLQFKNILVVPPFIPKIHTFELNGSQLCENDVLSDAILKIDGKEIPVHRAIVHCWNEAFVSFLDTPISLEEEIQLQEYQKEAKPCHKQEDHEIQNEQRAIMNIGVEEKNNDNITTPTMTTNEVLECNNNNNDVINTPKDDYENSNVNNNNNNNDQDDDEHDDMIFPLEHDDILKIPSKNIFDSLGEILVRKLLQFMYTGDTGDLSSEQLVKLMNFSMKHSLTPLLEYLQNQTGEQEIEKIKPPVQVIIQRVIRYKQLLRNKLYHDVIITCEEKKFYAHRIILALWSEPFKAMFSSQMRESVQKEIFLPEVNSSEFKIFLEFCYSGDVIIPPQRAIPTLILADRFTVTPLQEKCCEVIVKHIDLENCCALLEMSSLYNWAVLRAHCMRFIETNFKTIAVYYHDEFITLSPDALLELILSDDLMVSDEFEVFNVFNTWVHFNYPNPDQLSAYDQQILVDLICCIRFPLLSEKFLEEMSNHFLYKQSSKFRTQIERTLKYLRSFDETTTTTTTTTTTATCINSNSINNCNDILLSASPPKITFSNIPTTSSNLSSSSSNHHDNDLDNYTKRPRNVYNHHQLLFSHCGDQNGVCYFIGCNYGKNSIWQNPHKARRLNTTFSCPPNRYSRPEFVVSRNFSTTNTITGNPPFCMIDFGEFHELICNHYTLRLDGSQNYLQNWLLQATNDIASTDSWVTLRVHQDEGVFVQSDWAVFGKYARFPYRYFRIVALPPCTSFGLSSIEFYGYYK